jgi:micrococcal nuclease
MKKLIFLTLAISTQVNAQQFGTCNIKYHSIYDGDTFYGEINCKRSLTQTLYAKELPIRVGGIDTPEMKTRERNFYPCEKDLAIKGKEFVRVRLEKANNIEIRNAETDKYFRVLGDVYIDGVPLAKLLIYNKLAVEYHGEGKNQKNWCNL